MNDLEKLKHLLVHWKEHNEAHVKTYMEWALRMDELSKTENSDAIIMKELSGILTQIADESRNLEVLLKKAQDII
jgi:hypothetical protein